MRTNAIIFYIITAFFAFATVLYWFTSEDPTGTTALAFSVALGFLIGYYLDFTARRLPPQPADVAEAEIADGAGELGFFSPHSFWPIAMAFGGAVTVLGLAFGWWLFAIGLAIFAGTSLGLVFEYYANLGTDASTPDHFHS